MSGRRISIVFLLIVLFVAGIAYVNFALKKNTPGNPTSEGDPNTIRGFVKALVPSGRVIVVQKTDGSEVLVSLTDASAITNEIGESVFYKDVRAGMSVSAAGIRGTKDNILIPSLITAKIAYNYNGLMTVLAPTIKYEFFSLHYDPERWDIVQDNVIRLKSIKDCELVAGASGEDAPDGWKEQRVERRINGNVFVDARYTSDDGKMRRVLTLENPGFKYGIPQSQFGSYIFQVSPKSGLSLNQVTTCTRATDEVLETFALRNSSGRIIVLEPEYPIGLRAGATVVVSGAARAYDGTLQISIIDENDKVVWRGSAVVDTRDPRVFGNFQLEVGPIGLSSRPLQLRVFQYSPTDGTPTDVVALPLAISS